MIPKIPVTSAGEPNIGSHGNQTSVGFQAAKDFAEGPAEGGLVGEVFEEIAGKNDVQFRVAQRPGGRTVLLDQLDFRCDVFPGARIEVHPEFPGCLDLIDELAITAAEIEDGG